MKRYAKFLILSTMFVASCYGVGIASATGGSSISVDDASLVFQSGQEMQFTFNPTLNLTLSSSDLTISNLAAGSSGISNSIVVGVETNAFAGFLLNATVGSNHDSADKLANTSNDGVSVDYNFDNIATNADLASLVTDNTWGYITSETIDADSGWSNYNGLPLYNSTPAELINVVTTNPGSKSIQFRIGAKAASTQPSGDYVNQINFTAVTKPIVTTYSVAYEENTVSVVDDMPEDINSTTVVGGVNFRLDTSVPSRADYSFGGWCTVATNDNTCSGDTYQPGDRYYIPANGETYNLVFYAIWDNNEKTTFAAAFSNNGVQKSNFTSGMFYTMQDMNSTICNAVAEGQEIELADERDEKVYWVGKLADGNCWMTQNLDFEESGVFYNDDTDVPAGHEIRFYPRTEIWKVIGSQQELYNPGDYCFAGDIGDGSLVSCSQEGAHNHLGNYYNWTAAVGLEDSSSIETDGENAGQSICPSGWQLPNYIGDKSFDNLVSLADLSGGVDGNVQSSPTYFVYGGGWIGDNSLQAFGLVGGYWTNTVVDNTRAYFVYYSNDEVSVSSSDESRSTGFPVRCVTK